MTIRQLPIELANQIAAGEVVERPASVIKELVENALDAGADELIIDVEDGGIKRLRVRDNGCGIAKNELALALTRHATSKIYTLDDLEAIQSLGFRGEALASISAVARLKLTSKPAEQADAWQAWTAGRDMTVEIEPAAHPNGTSIDIQDIFFNTPARRKFLRTAKTEFAHIDETIKRIALSRFDVEISLNHQGKRVRHYPKIKQASESQQRRRIARVCGQSFAEHALHLETTAPPFRLTGWLAPSSECRHQADIQYCFVNGRMMRDKLLNHAIRQAYERYLLPERVPTYALYFWLPPQQVDVNVHPAKHEVRFHQQRQVHDFILQAVADALRQQSDSAETAIDTNTAAEVMTHGVNERPGRHGYGRPPTKLDQTTTGYRAGASILPNAVVLQPAQDSDAAQQWCALTVVDGYWLLMRRGNEVAWLDLHQVEQRIVCARLNVQLQHGLSGQPLLVEVSCDLKQFGIDTSALTASASRLNQCGLNYTLRGSKLVIDTVPSMLRQGNVAHHCVGLIRQVTEQPNLDDIAAWLTQRAVSQEYSLTQAEHWMQQWQQQLQADNVMRYTIRPPVSDNE